MLVESWGLDLPEVRGHAQSSVRQDSQYHHGSDEWDSFDSLLVAIVARMTPYQEEG